MVARVLQRPTLVLNRNWQPVNVATVARALVLVWNESARVVDPDDYQLYTWADWSSLRPRADDPCIQAVRFPKPSHGVRILALLLEQADVAEQRGAGPVNRLMLVQVQPSAPDNTSRWCSGSHRALLRPWPWFDSRSGR